jgi:type II secretion system protein G
MRKSDEKGFTLIELLIVVAIIGMIAAIAIPNLLNAINRGKQKRTMADLRSISTAIESYSVDNTTYPSVTTMSALSGVIEPVYMTTIPASDGWGRSFAVDSSSVGYTVWSGGSDGGSLNYVGGATTRFTDSIVFANGQFAQWPEGSQTD